MAALFATVLIAGATTALALGSNPGAGTGTAPSAAVQASGPEDTAAADSRDATGASKKDSARRGVMRALAQDEGDLAEPVNSAFRIDVLSYTVTAAATQDSPGTVSLSGVNRQAETVEVPAEVTSPSTGLRYAVTQVDFGCFESRRQLVEVSLPSSVESFLLSTLHISCFYGCENLVSVTVTGAQTQQSALSSEDGVLYANDGGVAASLLCYPQKKTGASFSLPRTVTSIVAYAFAGNENLESVEIQSSLTGPESTQGMAFEGGIGSHAFDGCTALSSVIFPDGAQVATALTSNSPGIGSYAFRGCTSLKSIEIPAITSADQKANAYHGFSELNPNSNYFSTDVTFLSGYAPYWHNGDGPVARSGIGQGAFEDCTALACVSFAAGNATGAFAYWSSGSNVFKGCTSLESLVYEGRQAYWGDPSTSMQNGAVIDIWDSDHNALAAPTLYYAVDYYATDDADAVAQADKRGSERLARVEYERGTPTRDIATGASALAEKTAERALYSHKDADGTPPDPDAAALIAGLTGTGWTWALDGTQSRRGALSESCRAYLVKTGSLSAARLSASQTDALYVECDRNLSEDTMGTGSAFDPKRYYDEDDPYNISSGTGAFYTLDSTTGKLEGDVSIVGVDGTRLDEGALDLSYQLYDSETGELQQTSSIDTGGVWLITATPAAGSALSGEFEEWALVQAHRGRVVECFGEDPSTTEEGAKHQGNRTASLSYDPAPYAITIGAADPESALVAASYAGLVKGALNFDADDSSKTYGFKLNRSIYSNGTARSSDSPRVFSRTGLSASEFAVSVYRHFADSGNRRSYKATQADYPWGDTVLLVPAGHASEFATASAYAYANTCPLFFTEEDGSCSADTIAALKDFSTVRVTGGESAYSDARLTELSDSVGSGTQVSRIGGTADGASSFSLAVAEELVDQGKASWQDVTVSDSADPADCILALDYSGHEEGVTLVSSGIDDSKTLLETLHAKSAQVQTVLAFGRTYNDNAVRLVSESFGQDTSAFYAIWDADPSFEQMLSDVQAIAGPSRDVSEDKDSSADPSAKTTTAKASGGKKHRAKKKSASESTKRVSSASAGSTANRPGSKSSAGNESASVARPRAASTDDSANGEQGAKTADTKRAAKATASKAPAAQATGASADQGGAAAAAATPWWLRLVFVAVLVGVCAGAVVVLRKCR